MENVYILFVICFISIYINYIFLKGMDCFVERKEYFFIIYYIYVYQIFNKCIFCFLEWNNIIEGYSISNEDKIVIRLFEGIIRVLYSSDNSYRCGFFIIFRVLDVGEKIFFDGIGFLVNDEDIEILQRSNLIFVVILGNCL